MLQRHVSFCFRAYEYSKDAPYGEIVLREFDEEDDVSEMIEEFIWLRDRGYPVQIDCDVWYTQEVNEE